VDGCRYPLLTSGDLGRSREGARVSACRVGEPRDPTAVPLTPTVLEQKLVKPQQTEPPCKRRRPPRKKNGVAGKTQHAVSVDVAGHKETEPTTRSDPLVVPTPSVAEVLESSGETSATSSAVDKSGPPADPTPSVAEKPETLEEDAAVRLLKVETGVRNVQDGQEWEMPDWFQRRMAASAARHAQRGGVRLGMWGIPLKPRAQESTC